MDFDKEHIIIIATKMIEYHHTTVQRFYAAYESGKSISGTGKIESCCYCKQKKHDKPILKLKTKSTRTVHHALHEKNVVCQFRIRI